MRHDTGISQTQKYRDNCPVTLGDGGISTATDPTGANNEVKGKMHKQISRNVDRIDNRTEHLGNYE